MERIYRVPWPELLHFLCPGAPNCTASSHMAIKALETKYRLCKLFSFSPFPPLSRMAVYHILYSALLPPPSTWNRPPTSPLSPSLYSNLLWVSDYREFFLPLSFCGRGGGGAAKEEEEEEGWKKPLILVSVKQQWRTLGQKVILSPRRLLLILLMIKKLFVAIILFSFFISFICVFHNKEGGGRRQNEGRRGA